MQIRFSTFVRKEMLHILRDRRTLLVVLGIPVVLILLFGYTVSTDVNNVNFCVCAPVRCNAVSESVEKLCGGTYFTFCGYVTENEIDGALRSGKASAVIVFSADYERSGEFQTVLDGADVNTASTAQVYIQNILGDASGQQNVFEMHQIFNPQMRSSYNFIPGIMGLIFMLICAMMTSVSIVKEKEVGTMEVLLVSPIKPSYIIISKMVPYLVLGLIDLALVLLLSYFALEVPLSGGLWGIIAVSIVYLILSLALGILVSTMAQSQIVALLISAMVMMMPILFFSGMLFPVENLPWALRWISYVHPSRWYIDAMRKLMIEGVGIGGVDLEFGIISFEALLLAAVSTRKFNDRLEG